VNILVKQVNALPTVGPFALPVPVHRRDEAICRSPAHAGVSWAREELNLRPLPCQQNTGNRCARRRSPRSPPTVDPEGKRSVGVQLNALLHAHSLALTDHFITPSSCAYVVTGGDTSSRAAILRR
jgi:hypothetical protein